MSKRNAHGILVFSIPTLVIFFIYLRTLCPTIFTGDSGELSFVACTLGIAHPPGYPLLTILGKLAAIFGFNNPAYALNLLSALAAAASCGIFALTIRRLISDNAHFENFVASLAFAAGGILWGTSAALWQTAAAFEVYSLGILIVSAIVLTMVMYSKIDNNKYIYLSLYLLSLGISNHLTAITILPAILILGFGRRISTRDIPILAGLFIIGLTLYLYIPIRSSQNPIADWNHPANLKAFWEHITAKRYQGYFSGFSADSFSANLSGSLRVLSRQIPAGLTLLGVFGFISAMRKKFAIALSIALVFNIVLVSFYEIPDNEQYLLPASLILTIGLVLFIFKVSSLFSKRRQYLIAAVILTIVFALSIYRNYKSSNLSNNTLAYDYGTDILNSVGKNSVLISSGDNATFPLLYLSHVEDKRPDVQIYDPVITSRYLSRVLYPPVGNSQLTGKQLCLRMIYMNPNSSYLVKDHLRGGENPFDYRDFALTSNGLVYRWGNWPIDSTIIDIYKTGVSAESYRNLNFRGSTTLCNYYLAVGEHKQELSGGGKVPVEFHKAREIAAKLENASLHNAMGIFFRRMQLNPLADKEFEFALQSRDLTTKVKSDILTNVANLRKDAGKFEDAMDLYNQALGINPDNLSAMYNLNLTSAYKELSVNNYHSAIEYFIKATAYPAVDPNIFLNIAIIYDRHLGVPDSALIYYGKYLDNARPGNRSEQVKERIDEIQNSKKAGVE